MNPATRETAPLVKVDAATAAEVCARFYLDKEARKFLQSGATPREFVEALMENNQFLPGLDFMAHALPAREAIWWGCLCVQHTMGEKLDPEEKKGCIAAVQWVLQPNDANRVAAKRPAQALGISSPAGALAAAANQTGGSVGPPGGPVVPPDRFAPARAVALAVKVASTKGEPARVPATQRSLIELGIGVAEGRYFNAG
jgi:hypothetical protein